MLKIFLQIDSYFTTSLWKTAPWENMFFSVSMIKLRMFGGENVYISVVGASAEVKTQIISICTLFSDFSNWFLKFILIRYGNSFWSNFNKVCYFQLPFVKLWSNLEADGDLSSPSSWSIKTTQETTYKWNSMY